jgi:hypothetical protein
LSHAHRTPVTGRFAKRKTPHAVELLGIRKMWVIICAYSGLKFYPPSQLPLRVVHSNKVYLSQEALLISFSLVSRQKTLFVNLMGKKL